MGIRRERMYDVVCGMEITGLPDLVLGKYQEKKLYFCSEDCQGRFSRDPARFQGVPLITMRGVWKIFQMGDVETKVLRGLDLNVWEGDIVAIIGASGSGKSTALNMMGLLDRPTKGQIFYRGENVGLWSEEKRAEMRSKVFGFVFQQYNLVSWLSAYENVTLPLVFAGKKVDVNEVASRFAEAGLRERMDHRPAEMSGGEQQRVALLRALVNSPVVILGDEPTGNLDSATGGRILEMLVDLNKSRYKTLVVVTHDVDIAEQADQVLALKDGQLVRDHRAHKRIYAE